MQLLGLDANPKYAVVNMCDQHIVKMPSECYQLMITALWLHHVVPPTRLHKHTWIPPTMLQIASEEWIVMIDKERETKTTECVDLVHCN